MLMSNLNNSTSNLTDSTGRSFPTSYSSQSSVAPGFHHTGSLQGLQNIHGNFSIASMPGALASRNTALGGVASSGIQHPGGNMGNMSSGRFASNNLSVAAISQLAHGHSGVTNRGGVNVVGGSAFTSSMNGGGAIPGINSSSGVISNRNSLSSLGVSPILGNTGSRITSSMGNIVGANMGRNISSGGLSIPGLSARSNLTGSSSNNLNLQGTNRLKGGVLQQAPQMLGMLGNSYQNSGGPLSQSQVQGVTNQLSSMGMLSDAGTSDTSPFDLNDFPQLSGRPNSAGGAQGQLVALRKQGVGVSSIVQQNQEFSIQNEDFPALPGYKGGSSDFPMDLHQKEQIHENVSMMQPQHFSLARSSGFSLGGSYPSHRQQQQQQQNPSSFNVVDYSPANSQDIHLHGSDMFQASHGVYHSPSSGPPGIGLRPMNTPNPVSGVGMYNLLSQQFQHPHNRSQFRLQQMPSSVQSYRDQSQKSTLGSEPNDSYTMKGVLDVIRVTDQDLATLALGIDLTTLGLNLNSTDTLYKTFGSPWSEEPAKGDPEFSVPTCYYAKQPPLLQKGNFSKFQLETLFYIFYSMPKDEAQLYAAHELCMKGWFYHKELRMWLTRVANMDPLVKTHTYERGYYLCFDPTKWETVRKDNLIVHYEMVEKKPVLPSHSQH